MNRAERVCPKLEDWKLRMLVLNSASVQWQRSACLELWTRSALASVADEDNGPWPSAPVHGRQ